MKSFLVDENGFYGEFGGAYVPEILYKCVEDLKKAYLPIIESEEFQKEYNDLLKDYVGRPSATFRKPISRLDLRERRRSLRQNRQAHQLF